MSALCLDGVLVLALVAALSSSSAVLGPRRRLEGDKGLPYESGMRPLGAQFPRFWVSYYQFAVLFVVVDVDLAFLLPWIWLRHRLDLAAMVAMSLFLFLLAVTLVTLWRKGALECR